MRETTTEHEPKFVKQMTLGEFDEMFPDENACKEYLVSRRWPNGVRCPRCSTDKVGKLNWKPFHWVCKWCGDTPYRFSLYVGTVFENTNYPLRNWFKILYFMLTSKKGMSALQIHRMIGSGSYKTAFYICHRLRAGMADPEFRQLLGIVEVDETFVGGGDRNRHWDKKTHKTGGEASGKTRVIGAISRKGNVVCRMIENTNVRPWTASFTKRYRQTSACLRPMSTRPMANSASCIHIKSSDIAKANTSVAASTPTAWKISEACSSVASWALTTTSAKSTCPCI